MRCAIKKLRNKIISVVLVTTLVMGILVSSAFAYSYPSLVSSLDDCLSDLTSVGTWNNAAAQERYSNLISAIETTLVDLDSNAYVYLRHLGTNNGMCYIGVSHGVGVWNNGRFYVSEPNVLCRAYYITSTSSQGTYNYDYYSSSSSNYSINGVPFYVVSSDNIFSAFWSGDHICYSSSDTYLNGNSISPKNLDFGSFSPDSRIFEVWKSVDYPESSNPLEYINVRLDGYVDLNKISSQKIRFDYIDQEGNNFYKVFSESDFHDIQYDSSEDIYTFYIFPYLISSYEFTITGSTYYSDLVEWGSKSIELDLTFNEGTIYPLPQDWNSVYTVNQYFQSRSNGTVNGGVTKLALSDSGYLWVDYYQKVCHQAFDVKVLFIPFFMNSDLLSINLETLFQLYEQYDVIFTGVQPAQFNLLIPTLDYNALFTYYSQNGFYPALQKLEEAFVFYSNLGLNYDYSDFTWSLSTDEVGFIITRSFLLKRTLTALGDIDDRLLEFETNLVGEDSLGASLQTKLDNILSLEHDFFTDVSNFFQKLEYNLNGLSLGRIEKYLEDIWSATVGERNFNYTDLLPEPLKSIFLYFRGWFISSTQYMQDFIDVSNSSLYGDDLMKLPFEATVVPVLPFEPGTPTPIPIPTLETGLIEVGGD